MNLLSFPDLQEEIALGRKMRLVTKIRMGVGYTVCILKAVREENFGEAAIITSKLGAIVRCWEAKEKAEKMACLKSATGEMKKTEQ